MYCELGDGETAEGNPHHKDRYKEPNLVIEIPLKGLECKDDGKVEYHPTNLLPPQDNPKLRMNISLPYRNPYI